MMDRMGNLLQTSGKYATEATGIKKFRNVFTGLVFAVLLMSNMASAASVTYYLNATGGVNIGADGITNVNGSNQEIPPVITALMDTTGLNTSGAWSNKHPGKVLFNHSRWYFTSNYPLQTRINSNPAGKAYIKGATDDNVIIRLYDYDPVTGLKNVIGSSLPITITGGGDTTYSYTIYSLNYTVPQGHRLMLQFDFNQSGGAFNARVNANQSNSYLTVIETPLTYNVTINSIPSFASITAGANVAYSITINNTGNTNGNYSLNVSDSDTLNFLPSVLGNTTLFIPAGGSNQTTLIVTAYPGAPNDAINAVTVNATSIENPIFSNITQTITSVTIPITYNVTINSTPSSAIISAGANFTYNITVNNKGTTNGTYTLSVLDSDITNFSSSVLGMTTLFVPAGGGNQTTLKVTANGTAQKDAADTTTITATSLENSIYTNITQITTTVSAPSFSNCAQCHESYKNSVDGTKHNQTKNPGAPACTGCHKDYDTLHRGYIVNESNMCRNCHVEGVNLSESHGNHGYGQDYADCTQCHFANTTKQFSLNSSLSTHDHNLTVEYNFYNYNLSGIPLSTNGGAGKGMFPYYTCTLTCHNGTGTGQPQIENETIAWSQSRHAKATRGTTYNQSCNKCHSPPVYNASNTAAIATKDKQGIQCRVCHNLHNDTYSGNNIAFYNATLSSLAGSPVYDTVATSTQLCEKCHAGGYHNTSRDIYYNGSHKTSLGFSCVDCHMNSTINNGGEHSFEINNTATGKTGCEACHDATSVHSANFSQYSRHETNVTCDACHDATFVRNSSDYVVSTGKVFGSIWKNPTTNKWTTYRGTGTPTDWTFHNITKDVRCDKCHGGSSVKNGTIAQPTGAYCEGCHAQPPSGPAQPNMTGAHDLHKTAGFGATPETSCDYCHSTGGNNEAHPTGGNANVVSNTSTITTYTAVSASGNDDTCSGVTCHANNAISTAANIGTATWNSPTGACNTCHSTFSNGLPPTGNHTRHYINKGFACSECHGINADAGNQSGHRNNGQIDINFTNVTGSINASKECSVYCHSPNTNDDKPKPTWGTSSVVCGDCHSLPPTTLRNNLPHPAQTECDTCHGTGASNGTHPGHIDGAVVTLPMTCSQCHTSYGNAVNLSKHNQTLNTAAPDCTGCHAGYLPVNGHTSGNKSFIVNENNTCRNCHIDYVNGFREAHTTTSSDCTMCHFANTTKPFSLNESLFIHDHNLTVEHSYYEYNISGMPLAINSGTGVGMFPQYTCSLTCHAVRNPEKVDKASSTWLNSSHANSRNGTSDSKNNCAKCKSPTNYNDTLTLSNPVIAEQDWDGIQCRVCHNLHYRNVSGINGYPVAFYNATASSYVNYSVYEPISNNTQLCEKCHEPGSSHDSKFEGSHKTNLSFTCTSCHMNASFSKGMHDFQVKNMTSNVTGCEVCHKQEDHTVLLCKGKIDCVGCHDQTVQRNITGFAVSQDNKYGLYKDNTTGNWTTYKVSKGSPVSWPLHNITSNVTCEKCHGSISVYSGLITQATGSFCERCHYQPPNGTGSPNTDGSHELHKAKGYGMEPETSCDYCHSTGGKNELGHPAIFDNAEVVTNGSVSIGVYVKNNDPISGSDDTCGNVSCHSYNLSQGARVGNATWNTSTSGLCNQCHSTQTSGLPPTGNHTKHNARNVSCSTCHGNNTDTGQQSGHRDGQTEINLTKLASGGSYVSGTCSVYCHSPNPNDLVNSTPTWNITKIVCGSCHSIPPANFKTRNGNNHPLDPLCDDCHGAGAGTGTHIKHRNGAVDTFELKQCLSCHEVNGSASAKIDPASFGMHRDVNNTDGGLTNADCFVCHYNITGMFADYRPIPGVNVYECMDCHLNQTVNSTRVSKHIPGSDRSNLSVTTMKCEDCHVNSLNVPENVTAINSTMEKALHYGTRTNLVKPTAGTYNSACDNCHNSSLNKTKFGAQNKQVYTPHTATGKCNMCHIPEGEADTLHNSSLSIPLTVSCKECHTTYASKYKAPDITGTSMIGYSTCNSNNNCHNIDEFYGSMDTLARHNLNMTKAGTGGFTDTVYLNDRVFLSVTKGSSVIVTSRVNDTTLTGGAARVGGAEYYIDTDPGQGKGINMEAVDGSFDAVLDNWENVTAILNTSNLSTGEHKIFVRGIDIGKQWSAPGNATLVVQSPGSLGYINISSNVPGSIVFINGDSKSTDSNGNYPWEIIYGTYNVTVRKDPTYYANTSTGIIVTANNITYHNVVLVLKPIGMISGTVING